MPYFIGKILELPLTTKQDYSLFHTLNAYLLNLWKQQLDLIHPRNGLISLGPAKHRKHLQQSDNNLPRPKRLPVRRYSS